MGAYSRRRAVAAYQMRAVDGRRGAGTRRRVRRLPRGPFMSGPAPLATMPDSVRRAIRFVFTDIDDTLSTNGRITALAYGALERLHADGRIVVPVTGRPAGWCDHIARMWPVNAVVGENGAFYFLFASGKLQKHYRDAPEVRARNRERLAQIGKAIVAAVPGCAIAADQPYRETDLAIDYCEDVPALPLEAAERIAVLMREAGLHAKLSSIHVNGWFGDYDKLAMVRELFAHRYAMDLER